MEIANWKCPKCETLCKENFCPVCGFERANLVDQAKEPKQKELLYHATYQTAAEQKNIQQPQTDFRKSTEQENVQQPQTDFRKSTEQENTQQPEKDAKKTAKPKTTSHIPSSGELAPKVTKTAKPKKNKILGIIAVAVFLLCVIPANDYQSLASTLIEKCSSDASNIQRFLEKGEKALNEGEYDKAKYFYEDKVLALDSQNADAMTGLLRISMARSDKDEIADRLNQLSKLDLFRLGTSINRTYIDNAIESLEATDYEQLKDKLHSQQATIDDVVQLMNHYENYRTMFGFGEIQTNMVDKYLECYDIADSNNYDITFKEQLLNDALARFPENEQLLSKQQDLIANKAEFAKTQIDTALSNGDVEQARQWYTELCNVSDEDNSAYEAEINEYEAMVSFMNQANDLLGQSDYDGLCALIDSDSEYKGGAYYLIDGKYVASVENGNGVIYDANGIFVGDIVNNERSGNGKQFLYYIGLDDYSIAEGAWQNNQLNGEATCDRAMTDKSRYITSGNFTDGYENGTMTIKWSSWTDTYKAEMGDYVDAKQDSKGYCYAYVSNNGYQAWIDTPTRDGHGFWIR